MKKISIHKHDAMVYVDGDGKKVSPDGLPGDVSCVHWEEDDKGKVSGWIEYVQKPGAKPWEFKANKPITEKDVSPFIKCYDEWYCVGPEEAISKLANLKGRLAQRKEHGLPVDVIEEEIKALKLKENTDKAYWAAKREAFNDKYGKAKAKGR